MVEIESELMLFSVANGEVVAFVVSARADVPSIRSPVVKSSLKFMASSPVNFLKNFSKNF